MYSVHPFFSNIYSHDVPSLPLLHLPSHLHLYIPICLGRVVIAVAAGTKHVVALTAPHGDPWALTNRHLLPSGDRDATANLPSPHADMVIVIDPEQCSSSSSLCGSAEFPCHTLMVSARSTYLRGCLRACGHGRGRFRMTRFRVIPLEMLCSH